MKITRILAVITTAALATSVAACSKGGDDSNTIRIGTTDAAKKSWEVFEQEAERNGIDLEVESFADYSTPNLALAQGNIDVNLFQHLKFLAEYNAKNNDSLVPVASTEIVPLALFWKDHDSLKGIDGQTVAIPNDPSNMGRAINVLVQAKLVTLKEESKGKVTPDQVDIDTEKSKVKVLPVDAAQTTVAYGEGKPAIINNSYLDRAQIDPQSSVFQDDPSAPEAEPYINVFVTKADKQTDPQILKLAEIWHSPAVLEAVAQDSQGTSVPVVREQAELQKILTRLEEQV